MPLPMITADYSVGPAQHQYSTSQHSTRSASVRGSLPARTKKSHHPNSLQLASSSGNEMNSDSDWTQAMLNAGIPPIQIIGNILRWENPRSLFALLQAGDDDDLIYAFDSGKGLCKGEYSDGKQVTPNYAPTWEELFTSYRVNDWVEVIDIYQGKNMDGEERLVDYFSNEDNLYEIDVQNILIVTAASPCYAKCAKNLSGWSAKFQLPKMPLQYFAPYTGEGIDNFLRSVDTLQKYFYIRPAPLAHIDWVLFEAAGFKKRQDVESYLLNVVDMNSYCQDGSLLYDPQTKEMKIRYFNTY